MGCMCLETFSEQELYFNDLWMSSTICQISPDEYLEFLKVTIEHLKIEKSRKEAINILIREIVNKYLNCYLDYELFENIKFHVISENQNPTNSYYIIFALVFLIDCGKNEKLRLMEEIGKMINDLYKEDLQLRRDKNLIKNILIRYIDLVSFITVIYHLKIIFNKKNDHLLKRYLIVKNSFSIQNRKKLLNKLFEAFDNIDLENFLYENSRYLEHYKIRQFLIESDHGKNGLKNKSTIDNEELKEELTKLN
jgi:hypothetical protein